MSVVAHIGPPIGASGGPAGYLNQLAAALDGRNAASDVLFPPRMAAAPVTHGRPAASAVRVAAHRLRRALFGPPQYFRPDMADVRRRGGALESLATSALLDMRAENEASLANALARRADVLFAHDLAAAEAALDARGREQVWLMLHSPMPFGLYLAWSWGVPEIDWREILTFPDVRALIDRELDVCSRVDRIVIPCPEAIDELVRCDPRFELLRGRASYVMTGAKRSQIATAMERQQARARFALPLDQPVGLFIGNQEPYRGLDRLTAGLAALEDPRVIPGTIAVAGPDPMTVPSGPRIRALGRVNDVAALFQAVDFVVNVNRFSLFDLSVIETLEAGKPLLMHATGGNRAFDRLGAGCDMLSDLETRTIADGLERMFTALPATLSALGARSRACYDAHLTLDAFGSAHERLYATAQSPVAAR
jgi:glycosyltransferase involved in cell wall biosynthesis